MHRLMIGVVITLLSILLCISAACSGIGGGPVKIPKGSPDIGTQGRTETGPVVITNPVPPPPPPAPAPPPPVPVGTIEPAPPMSTQRPPEAPFTVVRVFYGTDRDRLSAMPGIEYGSVKGQLKVGTSTVSIPKDHRLGDWEKPTILTFTPDQTRHVLLLSVQEDTQPEFLQALQRRVQQSAQKEAFVFVHGYNVSFEDALQRTALLAYDLKFDGAPILFSWPSRGKTLEYLTDEESVETAIPDLQEFLLLIANRSGAAKIHLIAHSMGNRALLHALDNLRRANATPSNIAQVILTAPDVNASIFSQLIGAVVALAQRTTLYASSTDLALLAAEQLHHGVRAGEGGDHLLLINGIDSVDASAVDTGFIAHSYYGDNRSVITDLFQLIHTGNSPDLRECLSSRRRQNHKFWVFDRCSTQ